MIEVINLDGELLYKSAYDQNKTITELKENALLPKGVYFVRIHSGQCIHSTKLYIR